MQTAHIVGLRQRPKEIRIPRAALPADFDIAGSYTFEHVLDGSGWRMLGCYVTHSDDMALTFTPTLVEPFEPD